MSTPLAPLWSKIYLKKLLDPACLKEHCKDLKTQNKTIASLNGSFDLLHAGHLQILFEASLKADILIVALNSDRSIKQYKSPMRPLIPLEFRLQMIAALEFVDFVTWFDETTPCKILELIQPHVHVNGSEYGKNCVEAETVHAHGGRIHIVKRIPGLSTSEIIHKIKTEDSSCA
jgi:rfaE bifunctional protein nucleotidyltransferase chain/domain